MQAAARCPEAGLGEACLDARFCAMIRFYVADRSPEGEPDGDWCPRSPAHRHTLARAGVTLPRADGTFDPAAITAAGDAFAARGAGKDPCLTLGELTGWRLWLVRGTHLFSPFQGDLWPSDGLMTGDPQRGYGVFAFADRDRASDEARLMSTSALVIAYGSVRLWGEVVEHRRGFRAAFARIASLDGIHPAGRPLTALRRRYRLAISV